MPLSHPPCRPPVSADPFQAQRISLDTTKQTELSPGTGRPCISVGLNCSITGTQNPSLIFVHGFGCALEDWDPQVKALSPQFRCVALDLPGHGASAQPPHASMASLAAAVNEVKTGLGPGSKVLIGHSMGCRVIIEAYLQSRPDVAGLVFVDGSIMAGDPETGINRAKERAHAGIDQLTESLFREMFVAGSDPAVCDRLLRRAKQVAPHLREEMFVDMVRWDLTQGREALKQITVPVLALQSTYWNSQFQRVPFQPGMTTPWLDAITARVPQFQVKVVPNAGHFTNLDAPQVVNEEIGRFAAAIARAATL